MRLLITALNFAIIPLIFLQNSTPMTKEEARKELLEKTLNLEMMMKNDFPLPKRKSFTHKYMNNVAGYSPYRHQSYISHPYTLSDEKTICSDKLVIFVHEMGHAYFDYAMREIFPIWKEISENTENSGWMGYDGYSKENSLLESPAYFLYEIERPFNELFSDILTVVHFKDGAILSKELKACEYRNTNIRDFTIELENSNDKPMIDFIYPYKNGRSHAYSSLAPTRSFLWKIYLREKEKVNFSESKFLKKVFLVLSQKNPHKMGRDIPSSKT